MYRKTDNFRFIFGKLSGIHFLSDIDNFLQNSRSRRFDWAIICQISFLWNSPKFIDTQKNNVKAFFVALAGKKFQRISTDYFNSNISLFLFIALSKMQILSSCQEVLNHEPQSFFKYCCAV